MPSIYSHVQHIALTQTHEKCTASSQTQNQYMESALNVWSFLLIFPFWFLFVSDALHRLMHLVLHWHGLRWSFGSHHQHACVYAVWEETRKKKKNDCELEHDVWNTKFIPFFFSSHFSVWSLASHFYFLLEYIWIIWAFEHEARHSTAQHTYNEIILCIA